MRRTSALLVAAALVVAGCSSDDGGSGTDVTAGGESSSTTAAPTSTTAAALGQESERYADLALWHCHPDKDDDACDTADLATTTVGADGSLEVVEHVPADDPPIDCFYVYPTVDSNTEAKVRTFDEPINPVEIIVVQNTFARYDEVCRVFAPRYEQMTGGGYRSEQIDELLDVGDEQIVEAFDHYLATQNEGRPFVLVGHSQGTHHLISLLQERLDGDEGAALREQMVSALLIGPVGWIQVPTGEVTGGTFDTIPLCTEAAQTGCVVAFDSYASTVPPAMGAPEEGMERVCTNPADVAAGDEARPLAGSHLTRFTEGVTTPTEVWPDFYTGRCARDGFDQPYFEITPEPADGDVRTEGVFDRFATPTLHLLDPNFAMRDLLDLVAAQSAAIAG